MQTEKKARLRAKLKRILILGLSFLKIGLFTFGGGYAMIALIQKEFVAKRKWIGNDEFLDMVAIAESTPGPLAINSATYIGYKAGGAWGAAASTLCVCIPSFVIIYLISLFFNAFLSLTLVSYAFKGIQVAVVFLIVNAGLKMLRQLKKNVFNILLFVAVFACLVGFSVFAVDFSSIFYVLLCGACGLAVYLTSFFKKRIRGGQGGEKEAALPCDLSAQEGASSEKSEDVTSKTEQKEGEPSQILQDGQPPRAIGAEKGEKNVSAEGDSSAQKPSDGEKKEDER